MLDNIIKRIRNYFSASVYVMNRHEKSADVYIDGISSDIADAYVGSLFGVKFHYPSPRGYVHIEVE